MQNEKIFVGDNTPKDYIVVRCQLIHVKKKLCFFTEEQLGFRIVIPDTKLEAAELMAKFLVISEDYGQVVKEPTK